MRYTQRPAISVLAAIIALTLSACGGGSGGSNVRPSPPPTSVPPPGTPPVTPPTPTSPYEKGHYGAINAKPAMDAGLNADGITYAVLESTIFDGPVFGGRYLGKIGIEGREGTVQSRNQEHGTAVATTLLGTPGSGDFVNGLAHKAKFYHLDNYDPDNIALILSKGVNIFSISQTTPDEITAANQNVAFSSWQGWRSVYQQFQNSNILMILAAGNDGWANPSSMAAAPYLFPELKNWLTVVALDSEGNHIADYSNRCGVAKAFCLAAPGYVGITKNNLTDNYYWQGTSMATPVVAGAAGLVKQKFPWMKAEQIAQTLLTTATDLGETGIDDIYGHGRLNVGKAVLGPGTLTTTFDASIPLGMNAHFGNNISGTGGLVKSGGGSLFLSGDNSFSGAVEVREGQLLLAGKLAGDLTQNGGQVHIDLSHGIDVAGHARLGELGVFSNQYVGKHWNGELLRAGSLDTDTLSSTQYLFYRLDTTVQDNILHASLNRHSAETALDMGDESTRMGARGLDAAFSSMDAAIGKPVRTALTGLQFLTQNNTSGLTLDSLAGQAHATAKSMEMEAAEISHRWMSQRTIEALNSQNGGTWAMFGSYEGNIRPADAFDAEVRSNTFAVGADMRLGDAWVLGAAYNDGRVRSRFDRFGGNVDGKRRGGTVYLGFQQGNTTVSAHVSQASTHNDVERVVIAGNPVSAGVQSRTRNRSLALNLALEQKLSKQVSIGASLQHDQVRARAFAEQGNTGFELISEQGKTHKNTLGLYGKFSDDHDAQLDGWHWDAALGYYKVLNDNVDTGFMAAYAMTPNARFKIDGMAVPSHAFWLNFGISNRFGQNVLFFRGDVRSDNNGASPGLSLGYRRDF